MRKARRAWWQMAAACERAVLRRSRLQRRQQRISRLSPLQAPRPSLLAYRRTRKREALERRRMQSKQKQFRRDPKGERLRRVRQCRGTQSRPNGTIGRADRARGESGRGYYKAA